MLFCWSSMMIDCLLRKGFQEKNMTPFSFADRWKGAKFGDGYDGSNGRNSHVIKTPKPDYPPQNLFWEEQYGGW